MLTYEPRSASKLRVVGKGTGGWEEMCEEVNDGKIFYGLCRFTINEVFRFAYLSWIGEGVQGTQAGAYNSHSSAVGRHFQGFHVQVNGRNDNDLEEDDVIARLSTAIGANYDAGQKNQGAQGRDANAGAPKAVKRTDPGVIDQNASSDYWQKQNTVAAAPASGYKKDLSFQKASGAGSLKSKFETLAREQQPDAPPPRVGTPKPIKLDVSSGPSEVVSAPVASSISYDNTGATYDAPEETYPEETYADEAYAEEAYAEEAYAEEAYPEEAYTEEAYAEEGYAEEGYAEEGYAEEGYAEEGYAEEAYDEGYYEEGEALYATALYDYAGENADDLPFSAGDSILVLDQTDPSGWWKGQVNGQEGFFPSNFVELA